MLSPNSPIPRGRGSGRKYSKDHTFPNERTTVHLIKGFLGSLINANASRRTALRDTKWSLRSEEPSFRRSLSPRSLPEYRRRPCIGKSWSAIDQPLRIAGAHGPSRLVVMLTTSVPCNFVIATRGCRKRAGPKVRGLCLALAHRYWRRRRHRRVPLRLLISSVVPVRDVA